MELTVTNRSKAYPKETGSWLLKAAGRCYDRYTVLKVSAFKKMILDSSMVEHSAVNRVVVGSSPTRGAEPQAFCLWFFC